MEKRVVILAGGLGTRLKPFTHSLPKPLIPVGEYPILEIVIRQLNVQGFDRITLAVNHQAEIIQAYFRDGEQLGIEIDYSIETQRLGTMGPLTLIDDLPDNFLVMNGDILTDLDYGSFLLEHESLDSDFTISSFRRLEKIDYGVLLLNRDGTLEGFREKPSQEYHVSMGIYGVSKSICELIPDNQYYGFDDLMLRLLSEKKRINVLPHPGNWLDIGRPDDYGSAISEFENNSEKYLQANKQ